MLFFRVFTHFWRILPYFHNRVMPFRSVIMQKNGRGRVPFPKTGPAPISERNAANSRGRTKPACGGRNLIFFLLFRRVEHAAPAVAGRIAFYAGRFFNTISAFLN